MRNVPFVAPTDSIAKQGHSTQLAQEVSLGLVGKDVRKARQIGMHIACGRCGCTQIKATRHAKTPRRFPMYADMPANQGKSLKWHRQINANQHQSMQIAQEVSLLHAGMYANQGKSTQIKSNR
jgi:hypothetical protein